MLLACTPQTTIAAGYEIRGTLSRGTATFRMHACVHAHM